MAEGYTKDDAMFHNIYKTGGGIKVGNIMEQENGQKYRLVQGIDIDWNDAELPYTYAVTKTHISDTSDLLHLIDEISRGNSFGWEVYGGESYDDSSEEDSGSSGSDNTQDAQTE